MGKYIPGNQVMPLASDKIVLLMFSFFPFPHKRKKLYYLTLTNYIQKIPGD